MTVARTAIWCTPHAFHSSARVGAHHLSSRLAERGWQVLFLSNPVSLLHFVKWQDIDVRRRLEQAMCGMSAEPSGLRTTLPLTLLPLVRRFGAGNRWILNRWPYYTVPNLRQTLQKAGFDRPDLMVLDGPVAAPLIELVRPKHTVLRVLDRFSGFASTTPTLLDVLRDVAREVDLVTYSARDLADEVNALGAKKAVHIGNGADVEPFIGPCPTPPEYAAIPGPRIVYVGTMAEWFDYDLVAETARRRPNLSFILIGAADFARPRLPQLPNLHLLGPRPWSKLPGYLQHADVGIVPFDVRNHRDLVRGVNPIKLYEYAAAGLPAVCVHWPELAGLNAPIALSEGTDQFIAAIDRAIADPPSREALRGFARQHDWNIILDTMLRHARVADDDGGVRQASPGDTAS